MFEQVLSAMRDGVMVVDLQRKIIYANEALANIFSLPLDEVIGKRPLEVSRLVELTELIEEARKNRSHVEKEMRLVYPEEKWLFASADPISSENGAISIVVRDITEMKRMETIRRDFVANVSHELKTPLTAIRNYAETLLNGAIKDKEHNENFVKKIEKHAINLSALIDDLLEISSLEAKRELGAFAEVDLVKVFHHAMETVFEKAKKKNIVIEANCPSGQVLVSGIEDHIYRAFLNLLDNAINYTDQGGRVGVRCEQDGGRVKIIITDTGIGIAPEHLPRLFERFYRVDKGRSRDLGGTGLGLAIVKHVMNLHGGQVEVESEVGKGSTFTLVFPRP
ncbi:MAG: ATP-binding protein [bacterium]